MEPEEVGQGSLDKFESETNWPFAIREKELFSSLEFIQSPTTEGSSLLRFFGKSGSGKSFFTRELLDRYAKLNPNSIVIYLDVYTADLEASRFFEKFDVVLNNSRYANRATPIQVPQSIIKKWRLIKHAPKDWRFSYTYRVIRDLIAQIRYYVANTPKFPL